MSSPVSFVPNAARRTSLTGTPTRLAVPADAVSEQVLRNASANDELLQREANSDLAHEQTMRRAQGLEVIAEAREAGLSASNPNEVQSSFDAIAGPGISAMAAQINDEEDRELFEMQMQVSALDQRDTLFKKSRVLKAEQINEALNTEADSLLQLTNFDDFLNAVPGFASTIATNVQGGNIAADKGSVRLMNMMHGGAIVAVETQLADRQWKEAEELLSRDDLGRHLSVEEKRKYGNQIFTGRSGDIVADIESSVRDLEDKTWRGPHAKTAVDRLRGNGLLTADDSRLAHSIIARGNKGQVDRLTDRVNWNAKTRGIPLGSKALETRADSFGFQYDWMQNKGYDLDAMLLEEDPEAIQMNTNAVAYEAVLFSAVENHELPEAGAVALRHVLDDDDLERVAQMYGVMDDKWQGDLNSPRFQSDKGKAISSDLVSFRDLVHGSGLRPLQAVERMREQKLADEGSKPAEDRVKLRNAFLAEQREMVPLHELRDDPMIEGILGAAERKTIGFKNVVAAFQGSGWFTGIEPQHVSPTLTQSVLQRAADLKIGGHSAPIKQAVAELFNNGLTLVTRGRDSESQLLTNPWEMQGEVKVQQVASFDSDGNVDATHEANLGMGPIQEESLHTYLRRGIPGMIPDIGNALQLSYSQLNTNANWRRGGEALGKMQRQGDRGFEFLDHTTGEKRNISGHSLKFSQPNEPMHLLVAHTMEVLADFGKPEISEEEVWSELWKIGGGTGNVPFELDGVNGERFTDTASMNDPVTGEPLFEIATGQEMTEKVGGQRYEMHARTDDGVAITLRDGSVPLRITFDTGDYHNDFLQLQRSQTSGDMDERLMSGNFGDTIEVAEMAQFPDNLSATVLASFGDLADAIGNTGIMKAAVISLDPLSQEQRADPNAPVSAIPAPGEDPGTVFGAFARQIIGMHRESNRRQSQIDNLDAALENPTWAGFPTAHPLVSFETTDDNGVTHTGESNVVLGTFRVDGQWLVAPTMVDGAPISEREAVGLVRQNGADSYPQFRTQGAADDWAQEHHADIAEDGSFSRTERVAREDLERPLSPEALPEEGVNFEDRLPEPGATASQSPKQVLLGRIASDLSVKEGNSATMYADRVVQADGTVKVFPTFGRGILATPTEIARWPIGTPVPKEHADARFNSMVNGAFDSAKEQMRELPGVQDDEFLRVLTSVNFQLGVNWRRKWPNFWAHMKAGNYDNAVSLLHTSTWKKQSRNRVEDFVRVIERIRDADPSTQLATDD